MGAALTPVWARQTTPRQTAGPFYPWTAPEEDDADLTAVAGQAPALGEHLILTGQVWKTGGDALAGALVEIWQCDANGRYHHVRDGGRAPMDPGFQGIGRARTDAEGRYRFRTIKPVPYAGRTPHIHLRVSSGEQERLTTQLYIADHPRNARDGLYDPRLAVPVEPDAEASPLWQARFDVVVSDPA